MSDSTEMFEEKIRRKAIVLRVGGFRPPEDLFASWFGKVAFCKLGEAWPVHNGKPMSPLAQINLNDLPFKSKRMEGIAFVTVFVDEENLPSSTPNGEGWEIRTYASMDELISIEVPELTSGIKQFPMKGEIVEPDYPCWEDLPIECPEEIEEEYFDLYENASGFKFGGWPSLIQSEIFWAPWNKHPASPEYIFQIDSEAKANWSWGDGGVGYFGLGTAPGREDEWAMEWQCH